MYHNTASCHIQNSKTLASVAKQTGLSLTWLHNPKAGFLMMWFDFQHSVNRIAQSMAYIHNSKSEVRSFLT